MTAALPWLQALCGLMWLAEALVLMPGTWRAWRGRGDALDAGRVPILVIALIQAGFSARWHLWPHTIGAMAGGELASWATLYLLSAVTALFCLGAHRRVTRNLRSGSPR